MRRRVTGQLLGLLILVGEIAYFALPGSVALPLAVVAFAADAQAQSRSSGGYSRPRSSGRTPSFGGSSSYARPRTPSSGGYALPQSSGRRPSVGYGGASAGDRSYSRSQAAEALRRMRENQATINRPVEPRRPSPSYQSPTPLPPTGGGYGYPGGYGGTYGSGRGGSLGGWYRDRGWSIPGTVMGGPRSFGIWDAAFLWFMLSTLNQPGHSAFFRNHQDDPGYREWRQEAERQAQSDADIRRRLDELDRRIAGAEDQPRDPNYLPPDVPVEVATGQDAAPPADRRTPSVAPVEENGGGGIPASVFGVVLLGGGAMAVLAWHRSRLAHQGTSTRRGGEGMGPASPIRSAAGMLRHKMSGEAYAPSRFRIGMTMTLDPTPFLLAAGATHVPDPAGSGETVSVTEVGRIRGDAAGGLVRLYLPGDRAMLQLHLGANNEPDECRYFALLDEVTPADEAEWGAWLDRAEGMIGWPEFQTKNGKTYARIWSPGSSRVEPRTLLEEIEGAGGSRTVRQQAMLYGAPTNLPSPAPQTEYILVSAIEDAGQAWVEIRAGLDVNSASLSLA